jgi:hypothetical protein
MKTKVTFTSNLDEVKRFLYDLNDNWKGDQYPSVGERVQFQGKYIFDLEVVRVSFFDCGAAKEIELHIPSYYKSMSVYDWTEKFFAR